MPDIPEMTVPEMLAELNALTSEETNWRIEQDEVFGNYPTLVGEDDEGAFFSAALDDEDMAGELDTFLRIAQAARVAVHDAAIKDLLDFAGVVIFQCENIHNRPPSERLLLIEEAGRKAIAQAKGEEVSDA